MVEFGCTDDDFLDYNITKAMNNDPYESLREEVHELLHNKDYVYFSSNFIYKHGDTFIDHYGGCFDGFMECATITWTHRNMRGMKHILRLLIAKHSYPDIVYTDFERSLQGTKQLYLFLRKHFVNERSYRKYMIGVLIYHQLLYTSNLQANYTTGESPSYFTVMEKLAKERALTDA